MCHILPRMVHRSKASLPSRQTIFSQTPPTSWQARTRRPSPRSLTDHNFLARSSLSPSDMAHCWTHLISCCGSALRPWRCLRRAVEVTYVCYKREVLVESHGQTSPGTLCLRPHLIGEISGHMLQVVGCGFQRPFHENPWSDDICAAQKVCISGLVVLASVSRKHQKRTQHVG